MRKKTFLFIFSLFLSICIYAQQQVTISGKVIDENNDPLPGASVLVKGRKAGCITDLQGTYSLKVNIGETLIFSFIGLQPKEVKITNQKVLNVSLVSALSLDEVVVVGYGTVKKSDLVASVGTVNTEEMLKGNPTSVIEGLQGKMAGVQVQQMDGSPGAGINIQVRGANSFNTSVDPLYVIDGIPFDGSSTPSSSANDGSLLTTNALSMINPRDIESIEVLKDASATAIYGSRGANGVVLITTKKGAKGKPKIEYTTNYSVSNYIKLIDVLNGEQYEDYKNEQVLNAFKYEGIAYTALPYPDAATTTTGNTNWQSFIFQQGSSNEHNLTVSGADDNGSYLFSGSRTKQDGIIKSSGYERYTVRMNLTRNLRPWLKMGLNTNYTNTLTKFARTSAGNYSIIRSAMIFPSNRSIDQIISPEADAELLWMSANPYTYVNNAKDEISADNIFISSYADVKLTKFLNFRQNLGYSTNSSRRSSYYTRDTQEGSSYNNINGKAGLSDNWYRHTTSESLLQFNRKFKKIHSVNALLGCTYEDFNYGNKSIVATNFPTDLTGEYDISQGLNQQTPTSGRSENQLLSFLGRVNYSLSSKYLLTASFRRDGSSKFSETNKWANFMSGAVAWRLSEEEFIKKINFFDNLKLRLSYGETGNQAISSYATQMLLSTANYTVGGNPTSGYAEISWRGPVNKNLKWETTAQLNGGIDVSILKNKINLTIDLFYKKTRDLLQSITIPYSSGFTTMMTNYGDITNKGLEISGDFHLFTKTDFKWDINANISFIENVIGGLPNDQYASRLWYGADNVFLQRNGLPIGTIYGYVEDGFYDNEAEVRADKAYTNATAAAVKAKIGEIKYRDYNNDGIIDSNDKRIIGNTNPKFTYGLTNNFAWKNLTASFYIQGTYGNDIFNGNLTQYAMQGYSNIPTNLYTTRWTEESKTSAMWPRSTSGYSRSLLLSNRYVEDGSYLRLKNITIGYDIRNLFKFINKLNIYCSATNIFTLTNYSWLDPDVNAFGGDASRRGVDINSYPSSRTYSLGLKVTL